MNEFEQLPLKDIHLPGPISWWPPGWGWWMVSLLVVAAGFGFWWWRVKSADRRKRRKLVNTARGELERLGANYAMESNAAASLQDLSGLIRRVAMSVYQRESVAGLCAHEWYLWLQRMDPGKHFSEKSLRLLTQGAYQKDPKADLLPLISACGHWLEHLPPQEAADDPL